jgi:malate dehydrogenase
MREVAIVGAGELGGLIAHALVRRGAADVVRLIDESGRVAEGKALDISQAAPIEGFAAVVTGSTDLSAAIGSGIVVIADPAQASKRKEEPDEGGLAVVRRVRAVAPRAFLLCADLDHLQLVDRSVRDLHISPSMIIGSASEALCAAARAVVALELDVSPRDVSLSVLGVPPHRIVVAWQDAAVAGVGLTEMISVPVRRRLDQRIRSLWPVGPYARASAACKAIEAVSGISRRQLICFVGPDNRAGNRLRTAALPVKLGPQGVVEVMMPALSAAEQIALDYAMLL